MPTQWRTIAPIVGRTPAECLERYEKLLDGACAKEQHYEPADDPRKLRPGEIDPNPESKPARPDPVDMDEDEKEMLSEARARLANTRGKKARKAREKQLEEARRLASLQKRRELKAAGIDVRQRRRKQKGIDYNAEIPFDKQPPPGFFEVGHEDRLVEEPKFPTTIEELEGKLRSDVEAQLRKQDVAQNRIAQRRDAPGAVNQVNRLNDPEAVRKRAKLRLSAPQILDGELEEIARMGYASDLLPGEDELGEGNSATHALLANYNQTPVHSGLPHWRTPQRTPGGKGDAILMEAENLARLRETQTPLLGGENPDLHPSDYSSVTPKRKDAQTPNPMTSPMLGGSSPGGFTPSRDANVFGMTPKRPAIRDELHINEGMESPSSNHRGKKLKAEYRRTLQTGLGNLPLPKNEYQIIVPELVPEEPGQADEMEEDASDLLARKKREDAEKEAALLRKRSMVLQRQLPRPPLDSLAALKDSLITGETVVSLLEQADEMIKKEFVALLEGDALKYPIVETSEKKKGGKNAGVATPVVQVPDTPEFEAMLGEAAKLTSDEVHESRMSMGHGDSTLDDYVEARDACMEDLVYLPTRKSYGLASVASGMDRLAAQEYESEFLRKNMEVETKKAVRLEQKLKVLTQGYKVREDILRRQIEVSWQEAISWEHN